MILFLDSEFTGLTQRGPHLISIGLVSEDGRFEFYAELPPETYLKQCEPWAQDNILPRLEGKHRVMQPAELRRRLTGWIGTLGGTRFVTDAPEFDFPFLSTLLDPWPTNFARYPIRFDSQTLGTTHQALLESYRAAYYTPSKPAHHALNDAHALRQMWLMAKPLDAFKQWREALDRPT
ncbi:MAG: 3'-5' exoribonuclease [Sulfuricella sp.]|nr:3'-5' exoribonuclease [Sulfuricella sp.]